MICHSCRRLKLGKDVGWPHCDILSQNKNSACYYSLVMKSITFWLAVFPLVVVLNAGVLIGIWIVPSWRASCSNVSELVKAVVFTGVMKLLMMLLNQLHISFKISDQHIFNTHVSPVTYELIKVTLLAFIALHEFNESWYFQLSKSQFLVIAAIYCGTKLMEFVTDFMPKSYEQKYKLFLKLYDDFFYLENNEDDSRTDATLQVVESLKKDSVLGETLVEVLPRKISIPNSSHTELPDPDSNSPGSFKPSVQASMPDLRAKPSKLLGKYKSCYDLVDKLYSVSPKNTFHLVTASATAVTRDEIDPFTPDLQDTLHPTDPLQPTDPLEPTDPSEPNFRHVSYDSGIPDTHSRNISDSTNKSSHRGSISFDEEEDTLSVKSLDKSSEFDVNYVDDPHTTASIHSTDTHLGGGGGGNFKYKFPDGSKLRFGGGAGFDYKRKHKHSSRSCSKSTTMTNSSASTFNSGFRYQSLINWLVPIHKKHPSIKKKLSQFNFRPSVGDISQMSQTSSLLSHASGQNYQSVDLEAQPTGGRTINKYEFNNYVRLSLGLDRFKIIYDPFFEEFGQKLIRDLSIKEIGLYYIDWLLWEMGSLMVFSLVYLNEEVLGFRFFVSILVTLIMKLFNVNLINNMGVTIWQLLTVKLVVNCVVFSILIVL